MVKPLNPQAHSSSCTRRAGTERYRAPRRATSKRLCDGKAGSLCRNRPHPSKNRRAKLGIQVQVEFTAGCPERSHVNHECTLAAEYHTLVQGAMCQNGDWRVEIGDWRVSESAQSPVSSLQSPVSNHQSNARPQCYNNGATLPVRYKRRPMMPDVLIGNRRCAVGRASSPGSPSPSSASAALPPQPPAHGDPKSPPSTNSLKCRHFRSGRQYWARLDKKKAPGPEPFSCRFSCDQRQHYPPSDWGILRAESADGAPPACCDLSHRRPAPSRRANVSRCWCDCTPLSRTG